jgi:hypothetical protein
VLVDLDVTLRVDSSAWQPDVVAEAVATALRREFSLRRRQLGQALHRSQLFTIIQAVPGVRNSDVIISVRDARVRLRSGDNGTVRAVLAGPQQLAYLDPSSELVVTTEEPER